MSPSPVRAMSAADSTDTIWGVARTTLGMLRPTTTMSSDAWSPPGVETSTCWLSAGTSPAGAAWPGSWLVPVVLDCDGGEPWDDPVVPPAVDGLGEEVPPDVCASSAGATSCEDRSSSAA